MTSLSVHELPGTETFEVIYEREHAKVARIAFLLLGNQAEAAEATQDVFLALFERWGSVDNPNGFLRTAAVNRCRDIGRRRTKYRRILRVIHPTPNRIDDAEYLLDALQQLDMKSREVIVLRYYLDHTIPEIAEVVDAPEGTVKSRLHRALKRLAELLGE